MLIVLGSLVVGGIVGSLLGIEQRLEGFGGWLQRPCSAGPAAAPAAPTGNGSSRAS